MPEECVLYDRVCINCGECDNCDLDSSKRCEDCGECIIEGGEFRTLDIEKFITSQEEKKKGDR